MAATVLLPERSSRTEVRSSSQGVTTQIKCCRTSSIPSLWRAEPGLHLGNSDLCAKSIPVTHVDRFLNFMEKGSTEESFLLERVIENWPRVSGIPREMYGRKKKRQHQIQHQEVSLLAYAEYPIHWTPHSLNRD